jgi:VanZ family protein
VVGLWPFHAPKNDVSWLKNENGLYLGQHGTVLSSGELKVRHLLNDSGCSVEIWLQPGPVRVSSVLLSVTRSGVPSMPLLLYQWTDHLVLRYASLKENREQTNKLVVGDIFHEGKRVFVTITSAGEGTDVYLDGTWVDRRAFRISSDDLGGTLVLAGKAGWSGRLLGLAVFESKLSAAQISRHYESWTQHQRPVISATENPVAAYLFTERGGNVVHSDIDSSTDLVIPKRYSVLHPAFLAPPWKEFRPTWSFLKDIGVNIAGFVPIGFFFRAYRLSVRRRDPGLISAVIIGFAVSSAIEILQGALPTRDSGITDILANTFGAGIGAAFLQLTKFGATNRLSDVFFPRGSSTRMGKFALSNGAP